jgi:hypothetical protein
MPSIAPSEFIRGIRGILGRTPGLRGAAGAGVARGLLTLALVLASCCSERAAAQDYSGSTPPAAAPAVASGKLAARPLFRDPPVTLQIIWRKTLHAIWRKPALAAAKRWLGGP